VLIPTTYRSEAVLAALADILLLRQPKFAWPERNHYLVEYSWGLDRLVEQVPDLQDAAVLDAGGAASPIQHWLAERCRVAYNASHHPGVVHASLRRANLRHVPGDLDEVTLPTGLDAVLSLSSIEHNPWDKIVRIARRLLLHIKPGGVLILTVPALERREFYEHGKWPEPYPRTFGTTYLFDATALRQLVKEVKDLAALVTPRPPAARKWRRDWRRERRSLDEAPPTCNRAKTLPYLSAGLVFRRRA